MKQLLTAVLGIALAASSVLTGCGLLPDKAVTVTVVYGSEKQEWLEPLVQQYNAAKHKTPGGFQITVQATAMGSIEAITEIIERLQPTVWSPASSLYLDQAAVSWHKTHTGDLIPSGSPRDLVLSPVVVAMWEPMAKALDWPRTAIGWSDIAHLATLKNGWGEYNLPEWGRFKFGHTHPAYSNSGVAAALAEAYAAVGKQRGLTVADLNSEQLRTFVTAVESSVIHYGTSTGFFGERMFGRGPSYLSAAVLYENLVVAQESKRLAGQTSAQPVVAIYPKEGTFWANHPYVILNGPWVTDEQKAAAQDFQGYLLDKPQQLRALALGFRPSDPSIPLGDPLDSAHGVDPQQPKTVLEAPPADVIESALRLWNEMKRPVDLIAVVDASGSMQGAKMNSVRASLIQFIKRLEPRDRLQVLVFNETINTLTPLSPIADKREDIVRRVSGIAERGGTRLYDAVLQACDELGTNGDPEHIRAIVVLTDGKDTSSGRGLEQVMARIDSAEGEGGNITKIFTIAFGGDADKDVLTRIAEATGAQEFDSTPETIKRVYGVIATFF